MFDLPTLRESRTGTREDVSRYETLAIDTVDETPVSEWNDLVRRVNESTIFHRHEWLTAIERAYDRRPCHIEVRKDGNLVGLLPQFEMSVPRVPMRQIRSIHPGFGGPVVGTDRATVLRALLNGSADLCGGRRVLHEIRSCNAETLRYHDHLQRQGYRPTRYKARFVIDLDRSYDEVFAQMDRSKKRGIERGRATDHDIVEEPLDSADLDQLHEAHVTHMRAVGGEVIPRAFFEHLGAMSDDLLHLSLYVEGEYVGAFIELLDRPRDTVHGFLAALKPAYFEHHVSELMYDHVFQWAIDHDFGRYDFGGGGGDFQNGVFSFKSEFGGTLESNFYWERGFDPLWPIVRLGRSLYLANRS